MNNWIENVQKYNGLPQQAIDSLLTIEFEGGEHEMYPAQRSKMPRLLRLAVPGRTLHLPTLRAPLPSGLYHQSPEGQPLLPGLPGARAGLTAEGVMLQTSLCIKELESGMVWGVV